MDYVQLISTVGFPIVACIALAWYVKYMTDGFNKTISDNTKAIQELCVTLKSSQLEGGKHYESKQ